MANTFRTFKDRILALIILGNRLQRNAVFISKDPGAKNHFICGLLKGNQLLLIDPAGITNDENCYKALAELQGDNILGSVFLSSQSLQKSSFEESLCSDGSIVMELITHILANVTEQQLNYFMVNGLEAQPATDRSTRLIYSIAEITTLLPDTLLQLLNISERKGYQKQIQLLRNKHLNQLKIFPEFLAGSQWVTISDYLKRCKNEAVSQVVFNALLKQDKFGYNIHELKEYALLETELREPQSFSSNIEEIKIAISIPDNELERNVSKPCTFTQNLNSQAQNCQGKLNECSENSKPLEEKIVALKKELKGAFFRNEQRVTTIKTSEKIYFLLSIFLKSCFGWYNGCDCNRYSY